MEPREDFLVADWPAPPGICAGTTLRSGGFSAPPRDSLNLGMHVGDDPATVIRNRRMLTQTLGLPAEPSWLTQVHGQRVVNPDREDGREADAAITTDPRQVLAILTADCLPIVFCDRAGTCRGAAHAGWRGLVNGVLEATVEALPVTPGSLMAWLGPAIGAARFEVGAEVRQAFMDVCAADAKAFMPAEESGKYLADIYALARARLNRAGVESVHGGGLCTIEQPDCFYSHRRDRGRTGRMATLIWAVAE